MNELKRRILNLPKGSSITYDNIEVIGIVETDSEGIYVVSYKPATSELRTKITNVTGSNPEFMDSIIKTYSDDLLKIEYSPI